MPQPDSTGTVIPRISLVRNGAEVWVAWQEATDLSVHGVLPTLTNSAPPLPTTPGWRVPVLARGDDTWMLADVENRLWLLRWTGTSWARASVVPFQMLPGNPVGPLPDAGIPTTWHLGSQVLSATPQGLLAAWQESDQDGPRSLHAAWFRDGGWTPVGPYVAEGLSAPELAPSFAMSSSGDGWLVFRSRDNGGGRFSQWSDEGFGELALPEAAAGAGQLSVVNSRAGPIVGWLRRARATGPLQTAQWSAGTWTVSKLNTSKQDVGEFALAATDDGIAVLAWSVRDAAQQRTISVAWLDGQTWRLLATGVQLDPGDSSVGALSVAATSRSDVVLAFDEDTFEKRVRMVHLRACGSGEKPAPFPVSQPLDSLWPKTIEEAAARLVKEMKPEWRETVRATPRDELIKFHHGWGTGIRNGFGLHRGNAALLKSCSGLIGHQVDAEGCSMPIIERTWELLQASDGGH